MDELAAGVAAMQLQEGADATAAASAAAGAGEAEGDGLAPDSHTTVTLLLLDSNAIMDMVAEDTSDLWKDVSQRGPASVASLVGWVSAAAPLGASGAGVAGGATSHAADDDDDPRGSEGEEDEAGSQAEALGDDEREAGEQAEAAARHSAGRGGGGADGAGPRDGMPVGLTFASLLRMLGSPPHGVASPVLRGNAALDTGRQVFTVLTHTVASELDGLKRDHSRRRLVTAFVGQGAARDACQAGGVLLELGADQAERVVRQDGLDVGAALAPADARIVSVARLVARQAAEAGGEGAARRVVLVTGDRSMRTAARRAGVSTVDWRLLHEALTEATRSDDPAVAGSGEAQEDPARPVYDGPWVMGCVRSAQRREAELATLGGAGILPGSAGLSPDVKSALLGRGGGISATGESLGELAGPLLGSGGGGSLGAAAQSDAVRQCSTWMAALAEALDCLAASESADPAESLARVRKALLQDGAAASPVAAAEAVRAAAGELSGVVDVLETRAAAMASAAGNEDPDFHGSPRRGGRGRYGRGRGGGGGGRGRHFHSPGGEGSVGGRTPRTPGSTGRGGRGRHASPAHGGRDHDEFDAGWKHTPSPGRGRGGGRGRGRGGGGSPGKRGRGRGSGRGRG